MEYLKIIITIALAVLGWVIGHHFTSERDLNNRKQEIVLPFLIESYQILNHDISMRNLDENNRIEKLDKLISDIQLFGTPKQAKLARDIAIGIANSKNMDLDPLINNLRSELREELNLDKIEENVRWIRPQKDVVELAPDVRQE